MTESILGHDCDGRELRAGDRVEIVGNHPKIKDDAIGQQHSVVGLPDAMCKFAAMMVGLDADNMVTLDDGGGMLCNCLRLVNSARDLFDKCAREADKIPTESTIRRAMPWTQPE